MVATSAHPSRRRDLLDEALARTGAERRNDPRRLAALAGLTVQLAEHTGQELLAARARMELANALRRLGRYRRAWSLLQGSEAVLRRCGDDRAFMQLVSFRTSIAQECGRWRSALSDLAIVERCPREVTTAVLWVKLGSVCRLARQLRRAQRAYWRAAQLANELHLPMVLNSAAHDMVALFIEAGAPEIADELLARLVPLHELVGSEADRLQTRWLRGRILAANGLAGEAAELLEEIALQALQEEARVQVGAQMALDALAVAELGRLDVVALLDRLSAAFEERRPPGTLLRGLRLARRLPARDRAAVIAHLRTLQPCGEEGWLDPAGSRKRHRGVELGAVAASLSP